MEMEEQADILTRRQRAVLAAVASDKALADHCYLTGGTALAGFYLYHRFSEDLDFFFEREFDISIDLYCIVQSYGWSTDELLKKAKAKFDWHIDPLQLGTQFMKAETVKDMPRMIEKIAPSVWRQFFKEEVLRFKQRIVK